MVHEKEMRLEGDPTPEQKVRLAGFLDELMLISRKYRIVLDGYVEDGPALLDLDRNTVIGVGLLYLVDEYRGNKVTSYDAEDSILDGVWPVDGPDGPIEQKDLPGVVQEYRRAKGERLPDRRPGMRPGGRASLRK